MKLLKNRGKIVDKTVSTFKSLHPGLNVSTDAVPTTSKNFVLPPTEEESSDRQQKSIECSSSTENTNGTASFSHSEEVQATSNHSIPPPVEKEPPEKQQKSTECSSNTENINGTASSPSPEDKQKPEEDEPPKSTRKRSYQRKTKKDVLESNEEYAQKPKKRKKSSVQAQNKSVILTEKFPRCNICLQYIKGEIQLYPGHPKDAVEEWIAITNESLLLFTGDEEMVCEIDARAHNKITHYSIYCKNGHLASLDTGLIDKNVPLYLSGYMKAIHNEDSSPEGGVATMDVGPINSWYISGFDGGEMPYVGVETAYGEYILSDRPSEAYAPLVNIFKEKMCLTKFVIEFLKDEVEPTYEDLVNKLNIYVPPPGTKKFNEEALLKHAQFLIDHVNSYDLSADPDEPLLIVAPCMRALLNLTGAVISKKSVMRKYLKNNAEEKKKVQWTKATTTKLVNNMFESFFPDQIEKNGTKISGPRNHRCGKCGVCTQPNCGQCSACKDMKEFGGTGRQKQACSMRRCPSMAIEDAEASESEDEDFFNKCVQNTEIQEQRVTKFPDFTKKSRKNATWIGEPIMKRKGQVYYKAAVIAGIEIVTNDHIFVETVNATTNASYSRIARVMYLYENHGKQMIHGNWLRYGTETVLGETADPKELFLVDECDEIPFMAVSSKVYVERLVFPENWSDLGNVDDELKKTSGKNSYFCQLYYTPENARFQDPECEDTGQVHDCPACDRLSFKTQSDNPMIYEKLEEADSDKVLYGMVKFRNCVYRVGDAVYLVPNTLDFKYKLSDLMNIKPKPVPKDYDKDKYPELYRKIAGHAKGYNYDAPEPFDIGFITCIYAKSKDSFVNSSDIYITVNKLYRPHNTANGLSRMQEKDLNLLYWSDEECEVKFANVTGKCHLTYSENLIESMGKIEKWTAEGPDRFYFTDAYDSKTDKFVDLPRKACEIGIISKKEGKSKSKSIRVSPKALNYPVLNTKLKTLDVFAGCGGLTSGLDESGVTETKWAIENIDAAANAYRLNFPGATVFNCDCNELLQKVMNGEKTDDHAQRLPQKGDVDMLCGGPPCQGFSGMNRFNSRQYSLFKNSLVVSFLSYCDYYRPRYFIMENVRNFVSFKNSMVLKLTLSCLIRMGYQCTFGILQAGNYGIPQTRRRIIILAAAPGENLPNYPEPTHAFSKRACNVNVVIDNKKYFSNCKWVDSAPYRTISVRDSMSDVPSISNGYNEEEIPYKDDASSHFQRMARVNCNDMLRDHICKDMSALVEARISYVPTTSGSDWRDLPNIVVRLKDNTFTKELLYEYKDKKAGKDAKNLYRGVCTCAEGRLCDPQARQDNTLIPWCLPHTGNRHNNWAGLYGRLEWDGFFSTTVTNPEPMGKQGRVLHPRDNRVVSVRECARSQGFKDSFRFYGNITEKHRQIGNAVPPLMAKAIGYEIKKCVRFKEMVDGVPR